MYLSIAGIGAMYLLMQFSILSVLPIEVVSKSPFVVTDVLSVTLGSHLAGIGTLLILIIALASLFSVMLGYTRIPYAAARDGLFFRPFGNLHPTEHFPHVSLLMLSAIAIVFAATLTITDAIKSIITMRVFTQFIAQTVGLMMFRRHVGPNQMPWKMWLYPIPAVLTVGLWIWIFASAKPLQQLMAVIAPLIGSIAFLAFSYFKQTWPFTSKDQ
jgi:amino acid transporter